MALANTFESLETPRLLLEEERLARNCAVMRERCHALGVTLRPHLKTAKSLDVARVALNGEKSAITVSTLHEAEYFARNGYRDILCASGTVPGKFAHAARIRRETGCDLILVTDAIDVAKAAARFAEINGVTLSFLIEIDCGEHRSGQLPEAPAVVEIARTLSASPHLRLRGVMAHAGHSYGADAPSAVVPIAAAERDAAVSAAARIRAAGMACEIVSIGSTPTVLMAEHLAGVTEARAGIYMFWDLAQLSRKMCRDQDIAVSVLAAVIGHTRHANTIILDAGALALSKDIGANRLLPDAGYGYLCDPHALQRLGNLAVSTVHQEHGTVLVDDPAWFDRLPVGSLVRILPNHACITCAGYGAYDVVRDGAVVARWERTNGW
jgi:D-serine deaminase-like pyridoxal phosphate-dependent protein